MKKRSSKIIFGALLLILFCFFGYQYVMHGGARDIQDEKSEYVLNSTDLISEFKSYKVDKGEKYSIEDLTSFPIANAAVSDARRSIKNVINLDTHIQIKLDFINPESAEKFVEKGWDEEKQMYYYLVYFNKEQKS